MRMLLPFALALLSLPPLAQETPATGGTDDAEQTQR